MERIKSFFKGEPFEPLAYHFAKQMCRLAGVEQPALFLAAGLLCQEMSNGNTALELSRYAGRCSTEWFPENDVAVTFPELSDWLKQLGSYACMGEKDARQPLFLAVDETAGPQLFLTRYWQYEEILAGGILQKLQQPVAAQVAGGETLLESLFPVDTGADERPRQAAQAALQHPFCVITGGPGTGKTTIVVKLLALMIAGHLEQHPGTAFRYRLVAPTGKAAARLKESILARKLDLKNKNGVPEAVLEQIHSETSTIHRCLGTIPGRVDFRYNAQRPLPVDCLIVDEASMVDLALMAKLVAAVPAEARIIFLGDEHQLASVEAGSVLGDICRSLQQHPRYRGAVVKLLKSHRFDSERGIGKLSRLINSGDGAAALRFIQDQQSPALPENEGEKAPADDTQTGADRSQDGIVEWRRVPAPAALSQLLQPYESHYERLLQQPSEAALFQHFEQFMILCALKRGVYGSVFINRLLEQRVRKLAGIPDEQVWYAGRPVMITANDYQLDLYNGDIGIVFPDADSGELKVFFKLESGYRKISPNRLPAFESAYAMTVHKSQGSEFTRILLLMPPEFNPVVTRELVYTGLTRARQSAILAGREKAFRESVAAEIVRSSGLSRKLVSAPPDKF